MDSLTELWVRGFPIGEVREFFFENKQKMFEYAQFLIYQYGGFSVRTDILPGSSRLPISLPTLKDGDLDSLNDFVGIHGNYVSYLLYQKRSYDTVVWQGSLWLDCARTLHGEINRQDKGLNTREAMLRTESLERGIYGNGRYDEGFGPIRFYLIKGKLTPSDLVDAASYLEGGREVVYYKQLRRDY